MKKLLAVLICISIVATVCGCKNKDKKENNDKKTTTIAFNEVSPSVEPEYMDSSISENTFDILGKMTLTCDCSNVFYTNIFCEAPNGIAEGYYSSPDVTATVDGKEFNVENSAYINISNQKAIISVTAYLGYVTEGSKISVTITNFNKINSPSQEGEEMVYDDISDEVVIDGTLTFNATADKNFGYLNYDLTGIDADHITISETSATVYDAGNLFGDNPPANSIAVIMNDGSTVLFDTCLMYVDTNNVDSKYDKTNYTFSFNDSNKKIDLSKVVDVEIKC